MNPAGCIVLFAHGLWAPWLVLGIAATAFLVFFLRFAHAQLFASQAEEQIALLHAYREQGVVPGNPTADYLTFTHLLGAISPAVSMQPEPWVAAYYGMVRAVGYLSFKSWAERHMTLLAAHQASRYRSAVDLLAQLRADA
jgi:hypothetical protein